MPADPNKLISINPLFCIKDAASSPGGLEQYADGYMQLKPDDAPWGRSLFGEWFVSWQWGLSISLQWNNDVGLGDDWTDMDCNGTYFPYMHDNGPVKDEFNLGCNQHGHDITLLPATSQFTLRVPNEVWFNVGFYRTPIQMHARIRRNLTYYADLYCDYDGSRHLAGDPLAGLAGFTYNGAAIDTYCVSTPFLGGAEIFEDVIRGTIFFAPVEWYAYDRQTNGVAIDPLWDSGTGERLVANWP